MSAKKALLWGYSGGRAAALQKILSERDFEVEAIPRLEPSSQEPRGADLVFCELSPPGANEDNFPDLIEKIQVLRITRRHLPIMCTSDGKSLDRIVQAVKAGASEYGAWPEADKGPPPEVEVFIGHAASEKEAANGDPEGEDGFQGILGRSPVIRRVFDMIAKVSATSSTVLITGESGTGKELVCRALHQLGGRKDKPLIPVNCGAIPEELLESELFGHEKGAFTGATAARDGRFQMAHGGTLFLDEVGEMSPKLQVKLLRVLQEKSFERVGGGRTIHVDVRVVAATNKDLEGAAASGDFRVDLFYRLNVIPIHLPSLKEMREDISLLVQSFIDRFRENGLSKVKRIEVEALEALKSYDWPGNVRELENLVERMVILAETDELRCEDLPERFHCISAPEADGSGRTPLIRLPEGGIDLKAYIEEIENKIIEEALARSKGVKNKAAQLLGLNRTTLVEKLKKKRITA